MKSHQTLYAYVLTLIVPSIAFIDDTLSRSFLPFVTIQDLPKESGYEREIEISNNEYVPSSKYRLGCPDDTTITFYDLIYDYALTGTKRSDYHVMCAGSNTVLSCIATKGDQVVSVPNIATIKTITTFNELLEAGYPVIFRGELTKYDIDDIVEIQTVYKALKASVKTFLVSSHKLASGGDYGSGSCVDRFNLWSMYLSTAFGADIDNDNINGKWDKLLDDTSCIVEAIENDAKHIRPQSVSVAMRKCPNTRQRATERATERRKSSSGSIGGGRRLTTNSYSSSQILAFINDNNHCPDGSSVVTACGNPTLGRCGYQSDCWTSICSANQYNDNLNCGCNNACFQHDYSCSCLGFHAFDCWDVIGLLFDLLAPGACHAGSTCIDITKMDNIKSKNSCMDPWCGYGEPYIEIEPKTPHGDAKWTAYPNNDYSQNSYTFTTGDGKRMCWDMRFTNFHIKIMDSDWDFDDHEWSTVGTTVQGSGSVGSGTGNTPKITYTMDKRGW